MTDTHLHFCFVMTTNNITMLKPPLAYNMQQRTFLEERERDRVQGVDAQNLAESSVSAKEKKQQSTSQKHSHTRTKKNNESETAAF